MTAATSVAVALTAIDSRVISPSALSPASNSCNAAAADSPIRLTVRLPLIDYLNSNASCMLKYRLRMSAHFDGFPNRILNMQFVSY